MLRLLFASLMLALSLIPLELMALFFWLRADAERYQWAISGPFPFEQIGGGPAMLYAILGSIVCALFGLALWRQINCAPSA